ncbi:MAG: hypothetical protein ACE5OZ_22340 [Candidatus Heimdallarchaeota archaeon]
MELDEIQVNVSLSGEDLEEFLLLEVFLRERALSGTIEHAEVLREAIRFFYEKLLLHAFVEVVFDKARETSLIDSIKIRKLMSQKSFEDPFARKIVNALLTSDEKHEIIQALAEERKQHDLKATLSFQKAKDILEKVNHS